MHCLHHDGPTLKLEGNKALLAQTHATTHYLHWNLLIQAAEAVGPPERQFMSIELGMLD